MASQTPVDAQPAKGDGKDTQLLSAEEREQLTLLVADITMLMAKQIRDTFDASMALPTKPRHILQTGDINPNVIRSGPHKETEEEEKTRNLLERREKELSEPKMLELKDEAIKFFEEWRASLMSRAEDAVNNLREAMIEQNQEESAGKPLQTKAPSEAQVMSKHCIFILRLNFVSILTESPQRLARTRKKQTLH